MNRFIISIITFFSFLPLLSSAELLVKKSAIESKPESSLVSFESHINGERVDIKWETKQQENIASFVIEKSRDRVNFEKLCDVNASPKEMSYVNYFNVDFNVWEGKTFYRITEIDVNGNTLNSNIVSVVDNKKRNPVKITERSISVDGLFSEVDSLEEEALVVVRNRKGDEMYSKVIITSQNGDDYTGYDTEAVIPVGKYLVIGSNDDRLFCKKLRLRNW